MSSNDLSFFDPNSIYIFGHKNPDADAICAPIAYAALKKAMGFPNYIAARCGNTNARIDAILNIFKTPAPVLINDVSPCVEDVMASPVYKLHAEDSCAKALELIDKHNIRCLPIVDKEDHVEGLVSIFDLGEYFIPDIKNYRNLRHVRTNIDSIVQALNAASLHRYEPHRIEDLYARIGAMEYESFKVRIASKETPAGQSIIITGDREDIQHYAIEAGVRLVVVTGGFPIKEEIVKLASQKNVNLIATHYDTASTSWMIRTASHINTLSHTKQDIQTFTPHEKLTSVRRKVAESSHDAFPILNEGNKLIGIITRSDLLKTVKRQIVLIDHNELIQAVNGAGEVNIVAVIDHHKLGNPPTSYPILFHNEPLGSSCTIIASMFKKEGIKPSPDLAGLMMSGLITDTLLLKSPTTTNTDVEILKWLSEISKVDPKHLADKIFNSGSIILSQSAAEVVRADCKIYEDGKIRYSAAQVEELGFENFIEHADTIITALDEYRKTENLNFSVLLMTDINTQNSYLLASGNEDFLSLIEQPTVKSWKHVYDFPGFVSRKKQLVPYLMNIVTKLNDSGTL